MNNEPAFPCGVDVTQNQYATTAGITIRDYFAARSMQYALDHTATYEGAATVAYTMADAMMEARES